MFAVLIGLANPTKAQPKSQWAQCSNQTVTVEDCRNLAYAVFQNKISSGVKATLPSGLVVTLYYPNLWSAQVVNSATVIDGKAPSNLWDVFKDKSKLSLAPASDVSVKTKNFSITNGKVGYSMDYVGGANVMFLLYNGYPILKIAGDPCFNPQEPLIASKNITPAPDNTPSNGSVSKKDTVYIAQKSTTTTTTCDCPPGYVKIAVPVYGECTKDHGNTNSNLYTYGGGNYSNNISTNSYYGNGNPGNCGRNYYGYSNNTSYTSNQTTSTECDCDLPVIRWKELCVPSNYIAPNPTKKEVKKAYNWCEENPGKCFFLQILDRVNVEVVWVPDGNGGHYEEVPNNNGGPGGPDPTGGNNGPGGPKPRK